MTAARCAINSDDKSWLWFVAKIASLSCKLNDSYDRLTQIEATFKDLCKPGCNTLYRCPGHGNYNAIFENWDAVKFKIYIRGHTYLIVYSKVLCHQVNRSQMVNDFIVVLYIIYLHRHVLGEIYTTISYTGMHDGPSCRQDNMSLFY